MHGFMTNLNIFKHNATITKSDRQKLLNQKSVVIWLTGLSGSGKSTIANELSRQLHEMGKLSYILDGDNIRLGINKDLGFSDDDRKENIRRIAEIANLMSESGVIVITAFISPFRKEREMAKDIIGRDTFVEVFVNSPLDLCESRDPKGLYKKARAGQIPMFTGIDSPYEEPLAPYMSLFTNDVTPDDSAKCIVNELTEDGLLHHNEEVDTLDKQKTIAIDFDGVIHKYSKGFKGVDNIYDEPMEGVVEGLTNLKDQGFTLKILSSRPKQYIVKWLEKHDLHHFISDVSNHKFPATIYIDDRAYLFKDWSTTINELNHHPKIKK